MRRSLTLLGLITALVVSSSFCTELIWDSTTGEQYRGPPLPVLAHVVEGGLIRIRSETGETLRHLRICAGGCGCPGLPTISLWDPDRPQPVPSNDICECGGMTGALSPGGVLTIITPGSVRDAWCPSLHAIDTKTSAFQMHMPLGHVTSYDIEDSCVALFRSQGGHYWVPPDSSRMDVRHWTGSAIRTTATWRSSTHTVYQVSDMNAHGDVAFVVARKEKRPYAHGEVHWIVVDYRLVFLHRSGKVVESSLPFRYGYSAISVSARGSRIAVFWASKQGAAIEVYDSQNLRLLRSIALDHLLPRGRSPRSRGIAIDDRGRVACGIELYSHRDQGILEVEYGPTADWNVRLLFVTEKNTGNFLPAPEWPECDRYELRFFGDFYLHVDALGTYPGVSLGEHVASQVYQVD